MKSAAFEPTLMHPAKMFDQFRRTDPQAAQDKVRPIELEGKLIDAVGFETSRYRDQVPAVVRAVEITLWGVGDPVATVRQQRHRITVLEPPYAGGSIFASCNEVLFVRSKAEPFNEVTVTFENMNELAGRPVPDDDGVVSRSGQPAAGVRESAGPARIG